jgi:Na+-transporting NADH:ubiquinone oxidoreductase subunit C
MPESSRQPKRRKESVARTLAVAFFVSLVCSALVASAAVVLKPRQVANEVLEMRRNILEVAGLLEPGREVDELFDRIEPRIVELETGAYRDDLDPNEFDPDTARKDPERSVLIPAELDIARIGRRAKQARVYLVVEAGEVTRIVLPISGYGLWSTMYGFLALEPDANTVADIVFYSHGETAGIGDFVGKPEWQALWRGKRAYDREGELRLGIVKGRVSNDDPEAEYKVDGVSGATLTGNGVTNLVRYWLGDHGFGRYLDAVRDGGRS